ncbi:MAG: NusG domain II-containing protein [Clostridia bacterium]|nr:NusG domain II-containing protein [Clostridia bacterium]
MKRFDFLIIAIVLLLSFAALIPLFRGGGDRVRIEQDGTILYEGPLNRNAVIECEGNTVEILNGEVYITHADCEDGLCQRGACTPLHPLICLPNRLSVTIVTEASEVDDVTY